MYSILALIFCCNPIFSGNDLVVEGSLGGLQVLDLTPEGQTHQRIISFGRDPLTEPENTDLFSFLSSDLYSMANSQSDKKQETGAIQALSFKIKRPLLEQSNSKSQQGNLSLTNFVHAYEE